MPAADYSGAGNFFQALKVAVQEAAQVFAAGRMTQLAQRLGFDLTNAPKPQTPNPKPQTPKFEKF